MMWLKNDTLGVFFDERRGGMPVRDSFGFIEAASIEIADTEPIVIFDHGVARLKVPFFQSLNDRMPRIVKHSDSELMASGTMRRDKDITPHTYEMTATLKGNKLSLAYKLNVDRTEKITHSKIWLWTNPKLLQKCMMFGKIMGEDLGGDPRWDIPYDGEQPKTPITLYGSGGKLEVSGSTTPPVYAMVYRFKENLDNKAEGGKLEAVYGWARNLLHKAEGGKLEVVYGWARDLLPKGTYSGNLTLVYG